MQNPDALPDINWYDDAIAELTKDLRTSHSFLSDSLVENPQPEDLIIGGSAVYDALHPQPPHWYIGPAPEANFTTEYWAYHNEWTVRIAKQCSGVVSNEVSGLLARQVRGTWQWIPRLQDKRTAKIARIANASSILLVGIFEGKQSFDDQTMIEMRAASESRAGEYGFQQQLQVDRKTLTHLDKEEVVREASWQVRHAIGWAYMSYARRQPRAKEVSLEEVIAESFNVQARAEPSTQELKSKVQSIVDQRVDELTTTASALFRVVDMVQHGQRIRPSAPHHTVS